MHLKTIQRQLVERDKNLFNALENEKVSYFILGLVEEAGEVAGQWKKLKRARRTGKISKTLAEKLEKSGLTHEEYRRKELAKEMADVQMALLLLAEKTGIDLDAAVTEKFNEVSEENNLKKLEE